jgi:hypothetical protein
VKVIKKLIMDEFSGVDSPAQKGATVRLLKSAGVAKEVKLEKAWKAAALTDAALGHSHLVYLSYGTAIETAGHTSWARTKDHGDYYGGHDHPWVIDDQGKITIGEADGHTHTLTEAVTAEGAEMSLQKNVAGLLAISIAKAADPAATIAPAAELPKPAPAEEPPAPAPAAGEDDPIVHVSKRTGISVRKSQGDAVVQLVKQNDEMSVRLEKAEAERQIAVLRKRADDELPHLPGTADERAAMLNAIDGQDPAVGASMMKMLKAADAAMAQNYVASGSSGGEAAGGSAEALLEQRVQKRAAEKGISYSAAYTAELGTPEGSALYDQAQRGN